MPQRKPKLKIAIITDKLGTDDASSSTLIADEALARGHIIFELEPENLRYEEGRLLAHAAFYPSRKEIPLDLAKMDVILFRPNPPVDMKYLTSLFLLRLIEDKVHILNRPSSVIQLPEKIFPLYFKQFSPPTLISEDKNEIKNFITQHREVVLKPLYEYGGKGIKKLKKGSDIRLGSELPVVVQKFIKNVTKGDKRILLIDGKIAGYVLRKPPKNSFIANNSAGGSVHKTNLTTRDKKICAALSPILKKYGIMIAGIDVIDGLLTEINITSPTGFKWAEDYSGINAKKILLDKIEELCKQRKK